MQVLSQLSYSPTEGGLYQRPTPGPSLRARPTHEIPFVASRWRVVRSGIICAYRSQRDDLLTAARPFEAPAVADLPGGPVPFTLRQSPRARSLRVVIHPERGVVVTVPANRAGRTDGERRAVQFLGERERWVRRHLDRNARVRAELAARGGPRDGGQIRYLGELHRVAVTAAPVGARRSTIERLGDDLGDSLLIRRAARERRTTRRSSKRGCGSAPAARSSGPSRVMPPRWASRPDE